MVVSFTLTLAPVAVTVWSVCHVPVAMESRYSMRYCRPFTAGKAIATCVPFVSDAEKRELELFGSVPKSNS